MENIIKYKGYIIEPIIYPVGKEHPQYGKWMSGEFGMGPEVLDRVERWHISLDTYFFDTEQEAFDETVNQAKRYIEDKY